MLTYSLPTIAQHYAEAQRVSQPATSLFSAALAAGQRRHFWATLSRRPTALRSLASTGSVLRASRFAGRKQIRLDDIRGTEGRSAYDFDDQFFPLTDQIRQRWQSVAAALEAGLNLPPVQIIQVGTVYFVRDGHHRISVARTLGHDLFEAEVTAVDRI